MFGFFAPLFDTAPRLDTLLDTLNTVIQRLFTSRANFLVTPVIFFGEVSALGVGTRHLDSFLVESVGDGAFHLSPDRLTILEPLFGGPIFAVVFFIVVFRQFVPEHQKGISILLRIDLLIEVWRLSSKLYIDPIVGKRRHNFTRGALERASRDSNCCLQTRFVIRPRLWSS